MPRRGNIVEFAFAIGDEVRVIGQEIAGTITGMTKLATGEEYLIVYWHEAERHEVTVSPGEIEKRAQDTP